MENFNVYAAVLIARVFLGTLFLLQGYDKVFRTGIHKIIPVYKQELSRAKLPGFIITLSAYFTSWIELLGGLLLIFGVFENIALYALGIDLILVAVAMGLISPLWQMDYVFPRLILVLLLLLIPPSFDRFSLDYFFQLSSR